MHCMQIGPGNQSYCEIRSLEETLHLKTIPTSKNSIISSAKALAIARLPIDFLFLMTSSQFRKTQSWEFFLHSKAVSCRRDSLFLLLLKPWDYHPSFLIFVLPTEPSVVVRNLRIRATLIAWSSVLVDVFENLLANRALTNVQIHNLRQLVYKPSMSTHSQLFFLLVVDPARQSLFFLTMLMFWTLSIVVPLYRSSMRTVLT